MKKQIKHNFGQGHLVWEPIYKITYKSTYMYSKIKIRQMHQTWNGVYLQRGYQNPEGLVDNHKIFVQNQIVYVYYEKGDNDNQLE